MQLLIIVVLLFLTPPPSTKPSCCACLPKGIRSSDVVSHEGSNLSIKNSKAVITVGEKLTSLRARCKRGKLVDRSGKPIYFFHLTGCWGNPPEGYQEILEKQARELARLRKRYTVIEMTCNPTGEAIP